MKINLLLLLLICTSYSFGQLSVVKIDSTKLPKQIKYLGHIKRSVKWNDSLGINYVLTTETGEYKVKDENGDDFKSAALYVYHFVTKKDSTKLLWRVYDFEKDCPFDINVKFVDQAFKVTDLDKNGIAEVWVMYVSQCTSDVSPAPTKIIMYEGTKKYAVRGRNKVQVSENFFIGGQYVLDENFKTGVPLFRQFAIDLWEKNKFKKL